MPNFLMKIQRFMWGRNGIDGLGIAMLILQFIVRIISSILRYNVMFSYGYYWTYLILSTSSVALLVLFVLRFLSKNLNRRRRENYLFMKFFRVATTWFKRSKSLAEDRARVRDTHKIYLCPKCKRKLKVPKGRGKIEISCPCSYKFYKRT